MWIQFTVQESPYKETSCGCLPYDKSFYHQFFDDILTQEVYDCESEIENAKNKITL